MSESETEGADEAEISEQIVATYKESIFAPLQEVGFEHDDILTAIIDLIMTREEEQYAAREFQAEQKKLGLEDEDKSKKRDLDNVNEEDLHLDLDDGGYFGEAVSLNKVKAWLSLYIPEENLPGGFIVEGQFNIVSNAEDSEEGIAHRRKNAINDMRVGFLDGYMGEQLLMNRHVLNEKRGDGFVDDLNKELEGVLFARLRNTNEIAGHTVLGPSDFNMRSKEALLRLIETHFRPLGKDRDKSLEDGLVDQWNDLQAAIEEEFDAIQMLE